MMSCDAVLSVCSGEINWLELAELSYKKAVDLTTIKYFVSCHFGKVKIELVGHALGYEASAAMNIYLELCRQAPPW